MRLFRIIKHYSHFRNEQNHCRSNYSDSWNDSFLDRCRWWASRKDSSIGRIASPCSLFCLWSPSPKRALWRWIIAYVYHARTHVSLHHIHRTSTGAIWLCAFPHKCHCRGPSLCIPSPQCLRILRQACLTAMACMLQAIQVHPCIIISWLIFFQGTLSMNQGDMAAKRFFFWGSGDQRQVKQLL